MEPRDFRPIPPIQNASSILHNISLILEFVQNFQWQCRGPVGLGLYDLNLYFPFASLFVPVTAGDLMVTFDVFRQVAAVDDFLNVCQYIF